MFRKFFALASFCFIYGGFLLLYLMTLNNDSPPHINSGVYLETLSLDIADYNEKYPPPDWWKDFNKIDPVKYPLFKLSQNYPLNEPPRTCPPEECKWKNFNFKTQSREYLIELLKYAFAGNLENDWRLQENRFRKWFHAPWMHPTETGREFVHGMTKERHLCRDELLGKTTVPCEKRDIENWGIGFYNERGAYYIGKVWKEMEKEKPDAANFPAEGFPEGTVTMKLLFTEAEKELHEAVFLENSFEWQVANKRGENIDLSAEKCLEEANIKQDCIDTLRLLQIDVAVRDDHAPTGWVFGTFIYNNAAPLIFDDYPFPVLLTEPEKENLRRWLKLEIVGLAFGNDENAVHGVELRESVINTQIGVRQKLGCGGRLNGVVDNPVSSCMSCHAFAESVKNLEPTAMPYDVIKKGCQENNIAKMFRNINPRSALIAERTFTESKPDRQIISLDFSLQLREGITRFCDSNKSKCGWSDSKNKVMKGIRRAGLENLFDNPKIK